MSEQRLTKWELLRIWSRFCFFHFSHTGAKKMKGHCWSYALSVIANKYYQDDEQKRQKFFARHCEYYNDEPLTGQVVAGYITKLETEIATGVTTDVKAIGQMKKALMEPVANIGNHLVQSLILPLLLLLGIGLSFGGNWVGAVVYAVSAFVIGLAISFGSFIAGFRHGEKAVDYFLSDKMKKIMTGLQIFLLVMIGGAATIFTNAEVEFGSVFRFELTDWLTHVLGPLSVVYLAYYLLAMKKLKQDIIVLVLSIIVVVGAVGMTLLLP